ncbi:MAG: AAA family ATPase [Proteobacteria bacterium]|nr:AAA family ATPase [Pseudomonadota bacterium]
MKEKKQDVPDSLVRALARRLDARVVETHISWILLTPGFAYKVKKPVRLPFLDYSTLARRKRLCAEEVRVNRAMAPSLYLGVVRIAGSALGPQIDGNGRVLEYAVRMRRFADGALFSERLAAGKLQPADVDGLAALLAEAHEKAPVRRKAGSRAANPHGRALAALDGAGPLFSPAQQKYLKRWFDEGVAALGGVWRRRLRRGRVRECHGDLHLANAVDLDGRAVAFDAIDFDPALRWIDVAEDAAFPAMDFAAQGRADYCWRFLNAWMDAMGEHESAGVLRYALAYRALVRAQAEYMRGGRTAQARSYARAALAWSRPAPPRLVITHGLPGTGKTFKSQLLLEREGAIRVRSDVERKRLFGLGALESSQARGLDIYAGEVTARTYERLLELARGILLAGFTAVIDAAFLMRHERDAARELARECGVPFEILLCEAPEPVLRRRLAGRVNDASEANAAVLARLAGAMQALAPDEWDAVRAHRPRRRA